MIYNAVALPVVIVGLATASVSGRVTLVAARGGYFHALDESRHIVWSTIGALAFPAQLALMVCALFVVWWPMAIALVLACVVAFAFMVTRATIVPLTKVQPLLNLITVASAGIVIWLVVR